MTDELVTKKTAGASGLRECPKCKRMSLDGNGRTTWCRYVIECGYGGREGDVMKQALNDY